MNIFALSECPIEAAQMCVDKHATKMPLETLQLLGAALRRHGASDKDMPLTKAGTPLRETHRNHPVTLWTGQTRANFEWAALHGIALSEEYTHRYGRRHFCQDGIELLLTQKARIPDGPLLSFFPAMPDFCKVDDPVQSYRNYYLLDKKFNIKCEWTKRNPPEWWQ